MAGVWVCVCLYDTVYDDDKKKKNDIDNDDGKKNCF